MIETLSQIPEIQNDLQINGIEYQTLYHTVDNLILDFGSYSNVPSVISWLKKKEQSGVLIDGFKSKFFIGDEINQNLLKISQTLVIYRKDNWEGIGQMLDAVIEKNHLLMVGDFTSEYGSAGLNRYLNKSIKKLSIGTIIGDLAFTGFAAKLNKLKITRRDFLKVAGLAAIGLPVSAGVIKASVYSFLRAEDQAITNGDYSDLILKINERFNDPELDDIIARTGIGIAKQSKLRDTNFLGVFGDLNNRQIQIWGGDHLNSAQDLELIQEIVQNPSQITAKILKREMAYLLAKGISMSEATERIALLRINMASIIPSLVKSDETGQIFTISPIDSEANVFYDERVLGFNPKDLSSKEIIKKSRSFAYNNYFELTDNSGNLQI